MTMVEKGSGADDRTVTDTVAGGGAAGGAGKPPKKKISRELEFWEILSGEELVEAVVTNEAMFSIAACIPERTHENGGRPRMHPPWVVLLVTAMKDKWGGTRMVTKELSQIWPLLRQRVREMHPDSPERWLIETPIRRYHVTHALSTWLTADVLGEMERIHTEVSCEQAVALGFFNGSGGTFARPARHNTLVGDGTVLTNRTRFKRGDYRLDQETGEMRPRRVDPTAKLHTKHGQQIRGNNHITVAVRTDLTNDRMILGTGPAPTAKGEALHAMAVLKRVLNHLPQEGKAHVAYDGAMRGKHRQELMVNYGVLLTARYSRGKGGSPREMNFGPVEVQRPNGSREKAELWSIGGDPCIKVVDLEHGKMSVPLYRQRLDRFERKTGAGSYWDWTGIWLVPEWAGGGTVKFSWSRKASEEAAKRKRPSPFENMHPLAYADSVGNRVDAESGFARLKKTLPWKRARSYGETRQRFDQLGYALLMNSQAMELRRRRAAHDLTSK